MELSITLIIIIATTLVSIGAFGSQKMRDDLIFYPPAVKQGQWYRFFSCGLIHADFGHLIFNMLALYLFGAGSSIETPTGTVHTGVEYNFISIFG
ncbi:MAG TPA: rhomboid family intramembrane serine protease, partial [Chitinophagaceae bacterium]